MIRRIAAILLAAIALGAAVPGSGDPAITVAILATLTGPQALVGQDVVDGFGLGLKQLGSRFANQEVRVVVVNDHGSPDTARQEIRHLLDHDRINFVLTAVSSGTLAATLPALADAKVFVLNLGAAPAAMAGAGCSMWMFDLAGQADGLHEAAGIQMAADQIHRVAVIAPDGAPGRDAVAALRRTFPGEVVATLTPRHGAMTFDEELAEIQRDKPDAVYDLLTGGMGVAFVRAWERKGLKGEVPLYAPWTGFERWMLPAMGDAAQGAVTLGIWAGDLDNPANRRFGQDFELEVGRPATTWAALGFDGANLLDAALKGALAHAHDPEPLRAALRRAEFTSLRGQFRFNTNHFPIATYWTRRIGRDAKGRYTNETKGVVLKDWHDRQAASCPMRWEEAPPPPLPVAAKPPVKKPVGH